MSSTLKMFWNEEMLNINSLDETVTVRAKGFCIKTSTCTMEQCVDHDH